MAFTLDFQHYGYCITINLETKKAFIFGNGLIGKKFKIPDSYIKVVKYFNPSPEVGVYPTPTVVSERYGVFYSECSMEDRDILRKFSDKIWNKLEEIMHS